jgi:crossover junction endodeoxyribonuclease RuvC
MIIMGIDPGTQHCGYAVIEASGGGKISIRDIGVWHLLNAAVGAGGGRNPSIGSRLESLHVRVTELLTRWNPQCIGLERAITFRNPLSALKLSEARGVIRLAAHQVLESADQRLIELSPTRVKKQATSLGLASKKDILRVLSLRFADLPAIVADQDLSMDAYDALAIAWTAWVDMKSQLLTTRASAPGPLPDSETQSL